MELELRGKNESAAPGDRKPMIFKFKVLDHWSTFQVRSMTQKSGKSGPARTSYSEGAIFLGGPGHEYHFRFDRRLCLDAFRPGRARSGQVNQSSTPAKSSNSFPDMKVLINGN